MTGTGQNCDGTNEMNNLQSSNFFTRSCLALVLVVSVGFWAPLRAQTASPARGGMMMPYPESMMEGHQAMMAEIKKQNDALATQVAEMNKAPQDKKLDLLSAIVTRMIEQRISMDELMAKMNREMMRSLAADEETMSAEAKTTMETKPEATQSEIK